MSGRICSAACSVARLPHSRDVSSLMFGKSILTKDRTINRSRLVKKLLDRGGRREKRI